MAQVELIPAPEGSFLADHERIEGVYVDCYTTRHDGHISLTELIDAFYTSPLFKAERLVLRVMARSPSTDADVRALATGEAQSFAAWRVEARRDAEILLADKAGRTKSWLSVKPDGAGTRLFFGSVVLPVKGRGGKPTLGPVFHSLLGAHKIYSQALLAAAGRRVAPAA
ncbi:MAG: hypothetical protein AAF088_12240 [Pseudomonadota bacterium]